MFIGHYATAIVAAAHPKAPPLWKLFVAAQLVDIAFFGFALLGIEHYRMVPGFTLTNAADLYDMRYTHSLIGTGAFAAAWAVGTRLRGGDWVTAWIGAAVVASHWFADLLVHAPDLTILGGGRRLGLGLWDRPQVEMPLELGLVVLALVFYASTVPARSRGGDARLWLLAVVLLAAQFANWLMPQPAAVIDPAPRMQSLIALIAYVALAAFAVFASRPLATGRGTRYVTQPSSPPPSGEGKVGGPPARGDDT